MSLAAHRAAHSLAACQQHVTGGAVQMADGKSDQALGCERNCVTMSYRCQSSSAARRLTRRRGRCTSSRVQRTLRSWCGSRTCQWRRTGAWR